MDSADCQQNEQEDVPSTAKQYPWNGDVESLRTKKWMPYFRVHRFVEGLRPTYLVSTDDIADGVVTINLAEPLIDERRQYYITGRTVPTEELGINPESGSVLHLLQEADITKLMLDALVCPTDTELRVGGGVEESIHRAASFRLKLYNEVFHYHGVNIGEAVLSHGYGLASRFVIHVAVRGGEGGEKEKLIFDVYYNSLETAKKYNARSIAFPFPVVSTGSNGCDDGAIQEAKVAKSVITKWLEENPGKMDYIVIVLHPECDPETYKEVFQVEVVEKPRSYSSAMAASASILNSFEELRRKDQRSHPTKNKY